MKTKFLFYLCLLLTVMGCEKSAVIDECVDTKPLSRSTNDKFSYFLNIDEYVEESTGNKWITGDIICTEETEYTFVFAFNGGSGTKYEVGVGDDIRLYNINGSSFRTITTKLKPGTYHCFVCLYFFSTEAAEARLVIRKINGSMPPAEGFGDLVALGTGHIYNPGGSEAYHWVCSKCNALNSEGSILCIACGNEKK